MTDLWTSSEIAAATGGVSQGAFVATGIAFDSREIVAGDLFVAMRGEYTDGHRFIDKAIAAGASGIVCEAAIDHPHVCVTDSQAALTALGMAARARTSAKVIGVTGSAGKTGTKEALFAALDRISFGAAHRSVKSYNNHVGVPLSLARMPRDSRFGVFEMGMNHAGELSALTQIVRPHVAIITTIAPAHIENFADESGIADAKAEIFEGLVAGGVAILPRDNPHYPRLLAAAERHTDKIMRFGTHPDCEVRLLDSHRALDGGSLVTARVGGTQLSYALAAPGQHWVMNSLAVLAAVDAVQGDIAVAGLALADLAGLAGRGARIAFATSDGGKALLIDESYNANPASMAATINELALHQGGRKIVVLGSMKELGERGPDYHAALADPIVAAGVSLAILVGAEMAPLADALASSVKSNSLEQGCEIAHLDSVEDATALLRDRVKAGDAILVKGSNAMGLSALVNTLSAARVEEGV